MFSIQFPRLITEDIQPEETESFEEFFAEFLELSYPDYSVTSTDTIVSFDLPLVEGEIMVFYKYNGHMTIRMFDGTDELFFGTIISWNRESRNLTKSQREQSTSELLDCGESAKGEQCYAFVHEDYVICYEIALNNVYSLVTSFDYCPAKASFSTRQEQMAYYLFEAFLSLEIPDELIK